MSRIDDPEVLDFIKRTEAAYPPHANDASAEENRRIYDAMCAIFRLPRPEGVKCEDRRIGGVPCRIYRSAMCREDVSVLYLHGGGCVVGSLDSHDDICAELADATGQEVVSASYRLAPEHIWPAQLDDVSAVWESLSATGRKGIVAGDSAGGNLAAGLCIRMRDRGASLPLGQVLIYPALGGDGSAPSYRENAEAPLMRTRDIGSYRDALSGGDPARLETAEAAPLRSNDLSGLPPAFIVTGDVDPLRDDGRNYSERLREVGISAHWRNESQLVHGFLRARATSRRARLSFTAIAAAISRLSNG